MAVDWRGEQQQRDYNEHHDDHRVPDAFHTVLLRRSIRRLHLCSPFYAPVMLAERLAPPTEGLSWHNTATAGFLWGMKKILRICGPPTSPRGEKHENPRAEDVQPAKE